MKYLIIIIEVFITNNIHNKYVLITIIIGKNQYFSHKNQINGKKPTNLYIAHII